MIVTKDVSIMINAIIFKNSVRLPRQKNVSAMPIDINSIVKIYAQ